MKKSSLFSLFAGIALAAAGTFALLNAKSVKPVESEALSAGEKVYLVPNSDWSKDNAKFAVYFFNEDHSGTPTFEKMDADGSVYSKTLLAGYDSIIFVRYNPAAEPSWDWDSKWNQTSDLKLSEATGNAYVIDGWDNAGHWASKVSVDAGRYLVGDFNGGSFALDEHSVKMTAAAEGEVSALHVSLTKGDKLKTVYTDGEFLVDYWYGYSALLGTDDNAKWCFSADGDDNMVCNATGVYSFYFKDGGYAGDYGELKISVASDAPTASQLSLKMHSFDEYIGEDDDDKGYCKNKDRWPVVQAFYNSLSGDEKTAFQNYGNLAADNYDRKAYDRYVAWANGNNVDPFTGAALSPGHLVINERNDSNFVTLIVVVSVISMTSIGLCVLIKKRKAINK